MKDKIKILCTLLTTVVFISMFVAEAVFLIIGNTEAFQTVVLGYIALRDLLFLGLMTRDAVIELKKDCYFAGFQDGKILCRSFEYARYFSNTHSAEQFVKEYLGYAGLRCNLCKVAWGLAVHGLESGWKENLKPYKNKGQILQFSSYHDGVNYQKENHLEQTTYVLPLVDREKELYIAA